jgi:allantoate deiminase
MNLRQDAPPHPNKLGSSGGALACPTGTARRASARSTWYGRCGSIDIRAPQDAMRLAAVDDVLAAMQEIAARRNVKLVAAKTHEGGVAACAPWLMEQIGAAIAAERVPVRKLPSGAGHDGMAMIDVADIGMLFVRCEKGISHNPAEAITLADVETSARVWLRFIENFDPSRKP